MSKKKEEKRVTMSDAVTDADIEQQYLEAMNNGDEGPGGGGKGGKGKAQNRRRKKYHRNNSMDSK